MYMNEDLKDHDVLLVNEKSKSELSVPNIKKNKFFHFVSFFLIIFVVLITNCNFQNINE